MKYYDMYGRHAVFAALAGQRRKVDQVFCTSKIFAKHSDIIRKHKYKILPVSGLDSIISSTSTPGIHQGVIARVSSIFQPDLSSQIMRQDNVRIAVLDQVGDTQNIGAIIRNAASFGISGVVMPRDHCPDETAMMAKAASGTMEQIEIAAVGNLANYLTKLKKEGFWIAGLDSNASEILTPEAARALPKKIAILLGSEGRGLRPLTRRALDFSYKLAINPAVESLNVSSASAIAFYLLSDISD